MSERPWRAVTLRRTKASKIDGRPIVDLPARTVNVRHVEFDNAEEDFYRALEESTCTVFDKYVKKGWKANYMHILVLLLRLRQACDHPLMLKEAKKKDGDDGVAFPTRDDLLAGPSTYSHHIHAVFLSLNSYILSVTTS